MSTSIIFDIETGPRPWAEIEQFYQAPESMPPFDESMVKYGQLKDPAKRAKKLADVKTKYEAELAAEAAARDAHKCEWAGKAALSAITGQVVAIGLRSCKGVKILAGDETEVIKAFWNLYGKAVAGKRRMIGHNILGFDLPVLVRRSYILGIDVPPGLLVNGRFRSDAFCDTMQVWSCGNNQDPISLDTLSRVLGGQGKPDGEDACTGATFAKLFLGGNAEDKAKAVQYLESDLENTWIVAERMGVL